MAPSGYVTTHVLDTSVGRPAENLKVDVFRLEGESRTFLRSTFTNADGRTDMPVISTNDMAEVEFELVFHAGDYLNHVHGPASGVRFLNSVPIRFGVSDASQHYHVPLLLSPHGYSTYRGS